MMMAGDMEERAQWLRKISEREEDALRELIDLYAVPLRRFLQGMTRNPQDSEDLTQEAFLRFLSAPRSFTEVNQLRNYLFQIAHNLAITKLTSAPHRREEAVEELPEVRTDEVSTRHLERLEEKKLVTELLYLLPPQQRKVVILRNWEELSFKEIAEILALAEGTVKAHYFFALKRLKNGLEDKRKKELRRENA
jgi:RNA polymerase sigma factor (sigma-70 family)